MINPDTDSARVLPSAKSSKIQLKKGDIMSAQTAGSGGFGNPLKRLTESLLENVLNEKVSAENAKALYGMVIVDCKVDESATAALRAGMAAAH